MSDIYVPYVHNPAITTKKMSRGRFYVLNKRGIYALEVTRLALDEENDCRFVVQREEHWIHTRIHGQYLSGKVVGVICD